MPRKKKTEELENSVNVPLPDTGSPDHFRNLVQRCIKAYEESNNDSLALDFCEVLDKRLRASVLDDEEYKRSTKSIYARQRLEEVRELQQLAGLAANAGETGDGSDGYVHPSERGKEKAPKKSAAADRDMLTLRFKAAQMIRELKKDMASAAGDTERDAVYMIYVPETREAFEKLLAVEVCTGSDDADIRSLIGSKEDVPEGTSGKLPTRDRSTKERDDVFFDVLPDGEIIER